MHNSFAQVQFNSAPADSNCPSSLHLRSPFSKIFFVPTSSSSSLAARACIELLLPPAFQFTLPLGGERSRGGGGVRPTCGLPPFRSLPLQCQASTKRHLVNPPLPPFLMAHGGEVRSNSSGEGFLRLPSFMTFPWESRRRAKSISPFQSPPFFKQF